MVEQDTNRLELLSGLRSQPTTVLDQKKAPKHDFMFKLIVIGDTAVGKSCLMHRATTNDFKEHHEVTIGVEFGTMILKIEEKVLKM